jgi:hypothetical protein
MPRSARGPRPTTSANEDRKAIEQRARDASTPFTPAKKGQWPFVPEETSAASDRASEGQSGSGKESDQ